MTLNQLPALATRLMQAKYSVPQVSHVGYRANPPQAIDTDSPEPGSHTAAAFASALKSKKDNRRKASVPRMLKFDRDDGETPLYTIHTTGPRGSWEVAAEESQRQQASALAYGRPVLSGEEEIQQLREHAHSIQLKILREHRDSGRTPSPELFYELNEVQRRLQQQVEHQAHKLQGMQSATQRSGNLLDEHG